MNAGKTVGTMIAVTASRSGIGYISTAYHTYKAFIQIAYIFVFIIKTFILHRFYLLNISEPVKNCLVGGLTHKLRLRQYRTKIVVQTRSQLFRQVVQNDAGIPAYFKEFWTKMTEKMQAYARLSAQRGLCAVLP
jgi:hypothetical protein